MNKGMFHMSKINTEEFTMWRALFAFALVDGMLSLEEQKILSDHLHAVPFSKKQIEILRNDMRQPQKVENFYNHLSHDHYKKRFCELARTLVWSGGDIDIQEKELLRRFSCLGTDENKKYMDQSEDSQWYRAHAANYENTAYINRAPISHIFDARI